MSSDQSRPRSDASTIQTLAAELETLRERVDTLESELQRKGDHLESLGNQLQSLHSENEHLEERVETLERAESSTEARLGAHAKKLEANKSRVGELQAREFEKGAHLLEGNVDERTVEVGDGRLERIHKDDGNSYFRLPESDDPLERGANVSLSHGDLLPIQQLSKLDDDMLRATTSSLPSRLAAKLWKARADSSVGDNPWRSGCKDVREYVTASDMRHWIRRQDSGISETYAKKLVSRTIDTLLDLSKNRLAIRKKRQRKNGLEYVERRVVVMRDADIPGEATASSGPDPKTTDVDG